jgi:hypothetical protein
MKKILWKNTALSGLCDRLTDLFLVATFAKIKEADLVVLWRINKNFSERQMKIWNESRFEDYKYENFSQYFNLPKNVSVFSEEQIANYKLEEVLIFEDYLGGVYSPFTFYNSYLTSICSYEDFIERYKECLLELTPTEKLKSIVEENSINVSVHLRRGDKVVENFSGPELGVSIKDLKNLDELTERTIEILLKNIKNPTLYFCSDDFEVSKKYEEKFSSRGCKVVKQKNCVTDVEKTYVDLFHMINSDWIIMSQKHSNFSMFASQVLNKNLIYFYEDNEMILRGKFSNTIFYKLLHS